MTSTTDHLLQTLLNMPRDPDGHALATRYAPILRFDAREPFFPLVAGYTVFRQTAPSPSFRQGHTVTLEPDASLAIEYAVWWDWDIGHLYELEHVWVFVDAQGHVTRGVASWHGEFNDMALEGELTLRGEHLVVHSEPGKHAFAPTPTWFEERRSHFKRSETSFLAGCSGVLRAPYIEDQVTASPFNNLLVRSYLSQHAFEPSWDFANVFEFTPEMLVPWPALKAWMPRRVNYWLDRLARTLSPSKYRTLRIGHRGARAHAPDNTLMSFRKAAELGADMVEFDVQLTADGQVAVVHDAYLTDAAGRVWPVRRTTLAELQAVDLGKGARVPSLEETLDVCQEENMGAYIEIKDGATVPAVLDALRGYEMTGHSIVASFRPDWVADARTRAPNVATAILFGSPHLDAVKLAQAIHATYVHPCWERYPNPSALLTPDWIARVREADLGIICWHEERVDEIAALRRVGVDGICSDAPELLR